jgi:OTU domain-containing protein 6
MAGSKKKRLTKSAVSQPVPAVTGTSNDDELVNDLLAQLDSRDKTVQSQSAIVLNEMQLNKRADEAEVGRKQDARGRFNARQVGLINYSLRRIRR